MRFSRRRKADSARQASLSFESLRFTTVLHPLPDDRGEADLLRAIAADWRDGSCQPAEVWLERHPQFSAKSETAVRVVYEEICLREERGEQVASAEIYRRFPQWQAELEVLFDCHRLIEPGEAPPMFPDAPQRLGELQLLRKLGRGAVGQVFLARQPSLSDRLLVVKLTPRTGAEHLSLARLQHTHIAPLYLVQDFPDENLRALCMPYLGGASWSSLLQAMRATPPGARGGRQIAELLESAGQEEAQSPGYTGPALRFLSRASYVQAVCWIGSCLADALHHAHQNGLVHLDIKPSNVLVAGDAQPMLLDFHLAREVVAAGSAAPEQLGGTRGYMSPEQEQAAQAVRDGREIARSLDGRSDIYSLGVLLYESLAGQLPASAELESRRTFRRSLPGAGCGLEDLVHKCLACQPEARYRDAGELATDLRRHLADLPLQGVPNRSAIERLAKWRRRKPHAAVLLASMGVVLLLAAALGLVFYQARVTQARSALDQARQDFESRDYQAGVDRLESGLQAVTLLPGHYDLKRALKSQLAEGKQARLGAALRELVEQLRLLDSFQNLPPDRLVELEAACARLWQVRSKLLPADRGSSEAGNTSDLLDLAVLWAELTVRLARPEQLTAARDRALAILDQAEALCGTNSVLELARSECSRQAWSVLLALKTIPPARTMWEHHVVGRYLFRNGVFEDALDEFNKAIELEPSAFWPNFYATLCAYRLERFEDALNFASVCVALTPQRPECYYNRALCEQAHNRLQQAIHDFGQALKLDPGLGRAALERGMILAQLDRHGEALADFKRALGAGVDPLSVHYQMAVVHHALHDRTAALENLRQVFSLDENYSPAVALKRAIEQQP